MQECHISLDVQVVSSVEPLPFLSIADQFIKIENLFSRIPCNQFNHESSRFGSLICHQRVCPHDCRKMPEKKLSDLHINLQGAKATRDDFKQHEMHGIMVCFWIMKSSVGDQRGLDGDARSEELRAQVKHIGWASTARQQELRQCISIVEHGCSRGIPNGACRCSLSDNNEVARLSMDE